jgi:putative ubiquitin-RnfH superfamily antitoxin RatB of RatAB toxin-antitoxin module
MINAEVVYATPERQILLPVTLPENCSVIDAISLSGILPQFDELVRKDIASLNVGIFSIPCALDREVKQGDRIEIYRPLRHDPKEARRIRAKK